MRAPCQSLAMRRSRERLNAPRRPENRASKSSLVVDLVHGLARNRLNDGDQVLHAMTELIRDGAQLLIFCLTAAMPVSGRPERAQCADVCFVCDLIEFPSLSSVSVTDARNSLRLSELGVELSGAAQSDRPRRSMTTGYATRAGSDGSTKIAMVRCGRRPQSGHSKSGPASRGKPGRQWATSTSTPYRSHAAQSMSTRDRGLCQGAEHTYLDELRWRERAAEAMAHAHAAVVIG